MPVGDNKAQTNNKLYIAIAITKLTTYKPVAQQQQQLQKNTQIQGKTFDDRKRSRTTHTPAA